MLLLGGFLFSWGGLAQKFGSDWSTVDKGEGWTMVMFLAGLQGIPRELHEAAAIEGATPSQNYWQVTLPLLRCMLVVED